MFEADTDVLIEGLDAANAEVAGAQRRFLREIKRTGEIEIWRHTGARDLAHWLSMRYGISARKAHRWIGAADALERLPVVDEAFVERVAESRQDGRAREVRDAGRRAQLVRWAVNVSCATVRRRADRSVRPDPDDVEANERARSLSWWWLDDTASAWDSRVSPPRRKAPSS